MVQINEVMEWIYFFRKLHSKEDTLKCYYIFTSLEKSENFNVLFSILNLFLKFK